MNDDGKVIINPPNPHFSRSMESQQTSRWIAYMADQSTQEEGKIDWDKIDKAKVVGLGLVVPRLSVIVPRVGKFSTFELPDPKGIGTIVDPNNNVMYIEAVPSKDVAVFKIGHISSLPNAKLYDMDKVTIDGGNAIAADIPGNLIVIPMGNPNFAFMQYKDGLHEMVGGRERLLGQVIGAIVDKFGNYIYAYYDNTDRVIIIQMNNIFAKSCKVSMSVQGIDKKKYINPYLGQFGDTKIINFPTNKNMMH